MIIKEILFLSILIIVLLPDYRFLKKVQGKYVFDQLGRLKEVMTVFTEANDSVSSCHTYYNYDNNINYQANLNLQAYVIDYDGVDSFFYFY